MTEIIQTPLTPSVRELAEGYLKGKTDSQPQQFEIAERAIAFYQKSKDLAKKLDTFISSSGEKSQEEAAAPTEQETKAQFAEFQEKMTKKMVDKLVGQESKQIYAEAFVEELTQAAQGFFLEHAEKSQDILESILRITAIALEAVAFQDEAANAVTLGDHGWHHLFQDLRDSRIIARGLKGKELTKTEEFMLGISAALHDIGYASDEVSKDQREDSRNYGLDKGHPLLSFSFILANKALFVDSKVFSQEEFNALGAIIVNHENPDRAAEAGQYEDIARAFAHADAGAAAGPEKAPPIFAQVAETCTYASHKAQVEKSLKAGGITEAEAEELRKSLVEPSKQAAIEAVKALGLTQQQEKSLLNTFDDSHISENSLKHLLCRIGGEMGAVKVTRSEMGRATIQFEMRLAVAKTLDLIFPNAGAVNEGAKLAVKVFGEQAGISLSAEQAQGMQKFLLEKSPTTSYVVEEPNLSLNKREDGSTTLATDRNSGVNIELVYNPNAEAVEHADYFKKVITAFKKADEQYTAAYNAILEKRNVQTT